MNIIERLNEQKQDYLDTINKLPAIRCYSFGEITKDEIMRVIEKVLKMDYLEFSALIAHHYQEAKRNLIRAKMRNFSDNEVYLEASRLIINNALLKFNELTNEYKNVLKKKNRSINKILDMYKRGYKYIDKDKVIESVKSLELDETEEQEMIDELFKYAKEMKEKEIKEKELEEQERLLKLKEEEEERINRENERIKREAAEAFMSKDNIEDRVSNFDLIKDSFERYEYLYPDELYYSNIELIFPLDDIRDVLTFECIDLDESLYTSCMLSLLALLDSDKGPSLAREINDCIGLLSNKFELYIELTDLELSFVKAYKNTHLTEEQFQELGNIQGTILSLKKNMFLDDEATSLITKMRNMLHQFDRIGLKMDLDKEKTIKIKSFVLFDYEIGEYGEKKPYVLQDLDESATKTLIDVSLDRQKLISNGYQDFNDLMDDLILLAEPRILVGGTFRRTDKIIRPVFYSDSQYGKLNDKMENSTGMVRIKPNLTSYTRFVDEKVEFLHRTTKFKQITEIIKRIMPNIEIDEEKDFGIFINYMDAFKKKDKSGYSLAINRQGQSKLRDILKSKNSSFTDEELKYIEEMIKLSLKTFSDLEEMNESFDFNVIKKIKNKTLK